MSTTVGMGKPQKNDKTDKATIKLTERIAELEKTNDDLTKEKLELETRIAELEKTNK